MGNTIARYRMRRYIGKHECQDLLDIHTEYIPCIMHQTEDKKGNMVPHVHDGDTVTIVARRNDLFPSKYVKVNLRLSGINAPEIGGRAKSQEEREAADVARERVVSMVNTGSTNVRLEGTGMYGRLLGDLLVNGDSVSRTLLKEHLAIEYHGKGKAIWTPQLQEQ